MPRKKAKTPPREWAYQGVECYVANVRRLDHKLHRLSLREPNKRHRRCWVATQCLSGHVPLFRLHHETRNEHCYCTTIEDLTAREQEGYQTREHIGYAMITQDAQHVPLMRTFNPRTSRYFYTTRVKPDVDEHAPAIRDASILACLIQIFGFDPDAISKVFADDLYICPSLQAAQQIIRNSRVAAREYSDEVMDCDDYAQLLKTAFIEDAYNIYDAASGLMPQKSKPYAMGVIAGIRPGQAREHYMNVLVTSEGVADDHTFWLVEPQTGKMHPASRQRLRQVSFVAF